MKKRSKFEYRCTFCRIKEEGTRFKIPISWKRFRAFDGLEVTLCLKCFNNYNPKFVIDKILELERKKKAIKDWLVGKAF